MSDHYTCEFPACSTTFEVDRLRREHHELIGELTVHCTLVGARTVNGILSKADFNFSSATAMQTRAKLIRERAGTNGKTDWSLLLEEVRQRVFEAESVGNPAIRLCDITPPERGDDLNIDGFRIPRRHPSIPFGDGGAAKSYMALYFGGRLAQRGLAVLYDDWELCGEDHRDRYGLLFGSSMPENLYYLHCDRPLVHEADRIRRIVREKKIDYVINDSIAPGCDGRPEEAEVASRYFRALREIGVGSLNVAHVNRSDTGDQKPFGSSFWHNLARSTWYIQAGERAGHRLQLGFFHRKSNLGPLCPEVSFMVTFDSNRTKVEPANLADSPELTSKMSVRGHLELFLRKGVRTRAEIEIEFGDQTETAQRTIRRYKDKLFHVFNDGSVGLRESGL